MRSILPLVLCVVLAALVGCQNKETAPEPEVAKPKKTPDWEWDGMAPSSTSRTISDMAYAQSAAAARADATMLPRHFNDAGKLNSLGLYRMDMIFSDPNNLPPVLYMDWAPDDTLAAARRASMEQWLTNGKFDLAAVAMKEGTNPGISSPADGNLARIWKTERPGGVISGSGDTDTSGLSPASAGPQGFQSGANSP